MLAFVSIKAAENGFQTREELERISGYYPPQKKNTAPSGWPEAALCIRFGKLIIQEGGANVKRGIGGGDPDR